MFAISELVRDVDAVRSGGATDSVQVLRVVGDFIDGFVCNSVRRRSARASGLWEVPPRGPIVNPKRSWP